VCGCVGVCMNCFVHGCAGYTGLLAHGVCEYVYVCMYLYTCIHIHIYLFVYISMFIGIVYIYIHMLLVHGCARYTSYCQMGCA